MKTDKIIEIIKNYTDLDADTLKGITEDINELFKYESFYCHDECVRNATEDYDTPKCDKQCDKCKPKTVSK